MKLKELLNIKTGITAVIGSGGKTALLHQLAAELQGTVILCTTTHIYRPEYLPFAEDNIASIQSALAQYGKICTGHVESETGKLTAPGCSIEILEQIADYVLVEADGSRGLPIKAHKAGEPVIPDSCNNIICVIGAGGFGKPVCRVCHRPEIFCQKSELHPEDCVTPEAAAKVLQLESPFHRLFVNQCDDSYDAALALSRYINVPVSAGALQKGIWKQL